MHHHSVGRTCIRGLYAKNPSNHQGRRERPESRQVPQRPGHWNGALECGQRGEKEKRKSSTASSKIVYQGPGGLPSDLGQRENIALEALNNAMNAGYSKEYQGMIKRYFNLLSKTPETSNIKIEN